ncbi:hypothetical protein NPIL_472991 [Nephila pilipes]|uniref:Uncharacterized protein n=1 Tax=Nephila pilipes TaxID=299642 RepID=A0A8X6USX5_NEPPI|nr:hypothetical protein NPIL_472991 [Nephila pilipes]
MAAVAAAPVPPPSPFLSACSPAPDPAPAPAPAPPPKSVLFLSFSVFQLQKLLHQHYVILHILCPRLPVQHQLLPGAIVLPLLRLMKCE